MAINWRILKSYMSKYVELQMYEKVLYKTKRKVIKRVGKEDEEDDNISSAGKISTNRKTTLITLRLESTECSLSQVARPFCQSGTC
jgi:hypothetical protein